MGRMKITSAQPGTDIQMANKTPDDIALQEATMHAAVTAFADDEREATLLIGQRQGRKQVFDSLQKLLTVTDLEDLKKIKESKKYKGVRVMTPDGKLATVTTWSDYCAYVEGRSIESVDLDLKNYQELGADCFDALRTLGVGPGKMRELRRAGLPSDAAEALSELAKVGDRDAVLDMAEELIARQAKEKAALASEVKEARTDIETKESRAADREREIERLQKELRKAKGEAARATVDESVAQLRERAQSAALQVSVDIGMNAGEVEADTLAFRMAALVDHAEGGDQHHDYLGGLIGSLLGDLRRLRDAFGLPIVNDHGAPDWAQGA